ncbi:HK97-gp10 family putative phage morphogenesis protein [Sphingobium sp. YG1]|uniref:HK97-gp10 family putative phage morphogenesis protein n=1 Tax=Sphingobium sp. YG1 TaxID=2082188 RepID=UPI000DBB0C30|nr:HK97-gp10 family putative phage morphogenesis protein [Sphingobium sp. YG1]BBD01841.1 hypothetical protein YGS_C1P3096 [Sphingobium sp. YG1]
MKLHGVEQMMRTLKRIQLAVDDRVQTRVALNAAEIVADRARQLAPVDTGRLRDSIGVSLTPPSEMSFSIRGEGVRVFIGPAADVAYAPYVEFGTWRQAAHPFMRPALDLTRDEVQQAIAHGLWTAIKASI